MDASTAQHKVIPTLPLLRAKYVPFFAQPITGLVHVAISVDVDMVIIKTLIIITGSPVQGKFALPDRPHFWPKQ